MATLSKEVTMNLDMYLRGHVVKNPIDEIKQLGYEVNNTRVDNKRYKIITK